MSNRWPRYLQSLEGCPHENDVDANFYIMRSNGGIAAFGTMQVWPIHMVESGPVAGVLGAQVVGKAIGESNLLTLDIGGTTTKTSLRTPEPTLPARVLKPTTCR